MVETITRVAALALTFVVVMRRAHDLAVAVWLSAVFETFSVVGDSRASDALARPVEMFVTPSAAEEAAGFVTMFRVGSAVTR